MPSLYHSLHTEENFVNTNVLTTILFYEMMLNTVDTHFLFPPKWNFSLLGFVKSEFSLWKNDRNCGHACGQINDAFRT